MKAQSLLLFAIIFASCGCVPQSGTSKNESGKKSSGDGQPKAEKETAQKPVKQADWVEHDPNTWLSFGSVAVCIREFAVRGILIEEFRGSFETEKNYSYFLVEVKNNHQTNKADYRKWNGDFFSRGGGVLKDEFGNRYKLVDFSIDRVVGQQRYDASIYPRETIRDVLVFEQPVAAARTLFLELPGANVGSDGQTFRVKFSLAPKVPQRAANKTDAEPPPPEPKQFTEEQLAEIAKLAEKKRLFEERLAKENAERLAAEKIEAKKAKEAAEKMKTEQLAATSLEFTVKNLSDPSKRTELANRLRDLIKAYPGTPAADEAAKLLKTLP